MRAEESACLLLAAMSGSQSLYRKSFPSTSVRMKHDGVELGEEGNPATQTPITVDL